jgi:hypothetical protein
MNCKKNIENRRFAACAAGARLLSICVSTARRAPVSESGSQFHLSAGCFFRDRQDRLPKKSAENLTRCEIFRGKVPPRKTQNQNHLEPWPRRRQQNYE